MRPNHRNLRISLPSGQRSRGKRFVAVLAALVCFVLGIYLYFSPGSAAHLPISCNLPSSPFPKDTAALPAIDPAIEKSAASANCSQEIWDFSVKDDTFISILKENLGDESEAPAIAESMTTVIRNELEKPFDVNTELPEDTRYSVTVDQDGRFLKAILELAPDKVFHCVRSDGGFRSWKEDVVLDYKVESIVFPISGSLLESVYRMGEGSELAAKLARVFWYDIDFRYECIRGDVCQVLFERRYADDRPSGYGEILCAVYQGKKTGVKTAVRFNEKYYDEKGFELKKDFMRSPLKTLRVTSGYSKSRLHPIFHYRRHHLGVDYGAPQGTSVWAVARGVVTFAGWKGGYGNFVCIKHDDGTESRYGHLSRILVRKGMRVPQGKTIGKVGMTGEATGPHLHFELIVGNRHIDPQRKVAQCSVRRVPRLIEDRFAAVKQPLFDSLQNAAAAFTIRKGIRSELSPPSTRSGKRSGSDA